MKAMKSSNSRPLRFWVQGLGVVVFGISLLFSQAPAQAASQELVLLNWADYMDPELIVEFEKKHGIKVKQIYFEHDEARDNMLVEANGMGYDLAIVNGGNMGTYRARGWLAPLSEAEIPNLKHIDRRWIGAFEAAEGHAMPYFWGTLGIGYRADLVPEPITSWQQLFRPGEALRGRIGMIGDPFDLLGMALKALGYSANSANPQELAEAERLLLDQKPFVRTYGYVSLSEESSLVTGEVAASMMYSGDALMVGEHHAEIVYVVPEEGGNIWIDYLVVMASSPKKKLANTFINFLNEPENAARLAEFVYYATPNLAAERLLPKEFLEDPTIYPFFNDTATTEIYTDLPPRAEKRRNTIFSGVVY
jgi:spermidine/putrescine transport system substrate-binding protein